MTSIFKDDFLTKGDVRINFPRQYRAMPTGYSVWWLKGIQQYVPLGPETEGPTFANRFDARKWCFKHKKKAGFRNE